MNKDRMVVIVSKAIIWSIYIFALGIFTSKFLIYLGMGFSLIFWLVKIGILRKDYKFIKTEYLIPILLFSASIFISGIGNWNNEILENKFFYSFIFFFIIINEISSYKELKKILCTMIFSAVIASFYGLYQHFYLNMRRVESFSFSLSWGNFTAVLSIFILIYIIWSDVSKKIKILLGLFELVLLVNLIFTQSRGAWLGFLTALVILGFLKGKKFLFISLIIILVIFMFLPNNYTSRFMSSFDIEYDLKTNRSNSVRIALWHTSLEMLKDNPINGVGYDNYRDAYLKQYKVKGVRAFGHAHNNLLNFAAEMGILGLSSFIYLMYIILKKLIIYYKSEEKLELKLFHFGSIFLFVIYHVQGLTQYNFGDTETLYLFFFVIALNVIIHNNLTGVVFNEN